MMSKQVTIIVVGGPRAKGSTLLALQRCAQGPYFLITEKDFALIAYQAISQFERNKISRFFCSCGDDFLHEQLEAKIRHYFRALDVAPSVEVRTILVIGKQIDLASYERYYGHLCVRNEENPPALEAIESCVFSPRREL